jgi:hypothetical protein
MARLQPQTDIPRQVAAAPASLPLLPAPVSTAFELLIRRYREAGLPMVSVGSWGPAMPQTRTPAPEAPSVEQLDRDMKQLATAQWGWVAIHQPLAGFTGVVSGASRREIERRQRLRRDQLHTRNPAASLAACMWASHSFNVHLRSGEEVAGFLELPTPATADVWDRAQPGQCPDVMAAIERGNAIWAALGAWPWSAFADGHPPDCWWEDERAANSLLSAMAVQTEEMVIRLRRACLLISSLAPGASGE